MDKLPPVEDSPCNIGLWVKWVQAQLPPAQMDHACPLRMADITGGDSSCSSAISVTSHIGLPTPALHTNVMKRACQTDVRMRDHALSFSRGSPLEMHQKSTGGELACRGRCLLSQERTGPFSSTIRSLIASQWRAARVPSLLILLALVLVQRQNTLSS